MGRVVGIDLGTTYSALGVVNELGKPEIVPNREGELITPSVVFFSDDGSTLVGSMAKHAAAQAPANVQQFVKRRMGERQSWPAPNGDEYMPEAISALVLKRLKEDAEIALGEGTVTEAVITVPAYFDDAQRRATMQAGEIAGLTVLGVLNEPTAAALAYGLDAIDAGTILVFDLGGGTLDVTIMKLGSGDQSRSFDVVSTRGDRNLGGFDWDNELMTLLNSKFVEAGGTTLEDNPVLEAGLREKAEIAKRSLTTVAKANVVLSDGSTTKTLAVTREEFEEATGGLLGRTKTTVELALDDANLTWNDIDTVVLVGGSTRMPAVRTMLEAESHTPLLQSINPDEAVALGAAIYAAHMDRKDGGGGEPDGRKYLPSLSINDVTSQALGTITVELPSRQRVNSVIIPRNTKIPAQKADTFQTVDDRQTGLRVEVTQGDDPDPAYVTVVGQQDFHIPAYPANAPFRFIYSYDIDQIIHIEVIDETANKSLGSFEVENVSNMSAGEVDAARSMVSRTEVN